MHHDYAPDVSVAADTLETNEWSARFYMFFLSTCSLDWCYINAARVGVTKQMPHLGFLKKIKFGDKSGERFLSPFQNNTKVKRECFVTFVREAGMHESILIL